MAKTDWHEMSRYNLNEKKISIYSMQIIAQNLVTYNLMIFPNRSIIIILHKNN